MASSMVIKVEYNESLRRFNALIKENGQLDLDIDALRAKILGLFNLPLDSDLTLTYVDEDGDIVTLVDDNDLNDVTKQNLKFLRINVQLNSGKGAKPYTRSSGGSTPTRSGVQNPFGVAEVLKSVPDPLRETLHGVLSKLSLDLASKASSSSAVAADLVDCISKLGLSCLNPVQMPQGGSATSNHTEASGVPAVPSTATQPHASKDGGPQGAESKLEAKFSVDNVTRGVGASGVVDPAPQIKPVTAPIKLNIKTPAGNLGLVAPFTLAKPVLNDLNSNTPTTGCMIMDPSPDACFVPTADGKNEAKKQQAGHPGGKSFNAITSTSSAIPIRPLFNECPFSGTPVASYFPVPHVLHTSQNPLRRGSFHSDAMVFHKGVQCDGCGAHPIVGPRYTSKVIDDYDLCGICFNEMGKESDYVKIDKPVTYRRPPLFKGFHEHNYRIPPPPPQSLSHMMRRNCGSKTARSKLDSRFILDVNVLDGTVMAPSTSFTKIWCMRNSGTVAWPQGARLVWIGGDKFSNVDFTELEIPEGGVPVDGVLDIAVDFLSPELPGRYISYWRMASASGTKFGQRVWVLIQVDASVKESSCDSFGALNLNLPPDCSGYKSSEVVDLNAQPAVDGGLLDHSNSATASEPVKPVVDEQPKEQNQNFPIKDALLVGHGVSASAPPEVTSAVSYPIIDFSEAAPTGNTQSFPAVDATIGVMELIPAADATASSATVGAMERLPAADAATLSETIGAREHETRLLKELEEMGFKQVDLNKEILRMNEYNLEHSVDALCGVADWDPLEELQEMGFHDKEMNRTLLEKNNGSIKRVVMVLLSKEKA